MIPVSIAFTWETSAGNLVMLISLNSNKASFKHQSKPEALSGRNVSIIPPILEQTQRTGVLNLDTSITSLKWGESRLKFLNFC